MFKKPFLEPPECIEISENSNNDNLFNNESNYLANDEDVDRDCDDEAQNSEEIIAEQIRDKAFKLINHFRSKNQSSSLLLNEIIKYFGDFINDLLYIIKDKTLNAFEFSEVNQQKYLLFHEKLLDPFEFISSNYKQQN
jgi:hypothetical protein